MTGSSLKQSRNTGDVTSGTDAESECSMGTKIASGASGVIALMALLSDHQDYFWIFLVVAGGFFAAHLITVWLTRRFRKG